MSYQKYNLKTNCIMETETGKQLSLQEVLDTLNSQDHDITKLSTNVGLGEVFVDLLFPITQKNKKLMLRAINKAINHYGEETQMLMCVEEMAELQKEILKTVNRGADNYSELVDEIADVIFTLKTVMQILCVSRNEIENRIKKKAHRLVVRINKERGNGK